MTDTMCTRFADIGKCVADIQARFSLHMDSYVCLSSRNKSYYLRVYFGLKDVRVYTGRKTKPIAKVKYINSWQLDVINHVAEIVNKNNKELFDG